MFPFAAIPGLGGGGGGLSFDGGTAGPSQTGAVTTGGYNIGGINTGTQSQIPVWVWIAAAAVAAVYFVRR